MKNDELEKPLDASLPGVDEPEVRFKIISERDIMNVENADTHEKLVEISGYDLQINFNLQHLRSVEEIEAACKGISDLFREAIVEKLLEYRKQ